MVFFIFSYLWNTLTNEVRDNCYKTKEVLGYHINEVNNSLELRKRAKVLQKKMRRARNYEEWKRIAEEFDALPKISFWKENIVSHSYDYQYLLQLRNELRVSREKDDVKHLLQVVRSNAMRGIANIKNPDLHNYCYTGTKHLIEDFQKEYILALEYIANCPNDILSQKDKLEFFTETRHAYGRTALMLSGGASMGVYHTGVIKVLYEENLIPRIISGSSMGSIIASYFCVKKREEALKIMEKGAIDFKAFWTKGKFSIMRKIKRFLKEGYLLDIKVLQDFVRDNIGDITFLEAYENTGWVLNITVTDDGNHDGYRLLNYLTAPTVLIWSAVSASCAIPFIFKPSELYCKNERGEIISFVSGGRQFVDGSLAADLPRQKLSEYFGTNCYIVSQTNPWVIPFMNTSEEMRHTRKKIIFKLLNIVKDCLLSEFQHRFYQLSKIGILPTSLSKWFNLVYQDYVGDVTFWPAPRFFDYVNIMTMVSSPNDDFLQIGVVKGEQRSYDKIAHVRSLVIIEKKLDQLCESFRFESLQNILSDEENKSKKSFVQRQLEFRISRSDLPKFFAGAEEKTNK